MNNVVEAIGYALFVAFLYLVWAPLALLGAAVLLVVWANVRPARKGSRLAAAVGASLGAARKAWQTAAAEETASGGDR